MGRLDPGGLRALGILGFHRERGGQTYAEALKLAARLAGEGRAEEASAELPALLQDRRAMWLNILSSLAVLVLLVDMIYKPGA